MVSAIGPLSLATCAWHPGGRRCECGRQGCLEAYCSAARISDDLDVTLEVFFQRLEQSNSPYQELWKNYLEDLATAVTTIHTILDCPVMIGGAVSQYLPPYRSQLAKLIRELDPLSDQTDFLPSAPVTAAPSVLAQPPVFSTILSINSEYSTALKGGGIFCCQSVQS